MGCERHGIVRRPLAYLAVGWQVVHPRQVPGRCVSARYLREVQLDEVFEAVLLPGEQLQLALPEPGIGSPDDQAIDEKYARGEVRIVTEQGRYPLSSVPGMLESGDYLLRPDYQRRHRWSPEKKSRLIESLIMNVPIPPVFLYEHAYGQYEVMDGLQRLSTIWEFYKDELTLRDLTEWSELNGRVCSTLPANIRAGIDRRYLSSIILLQETARSSEQAQQLKQLVFERINSGGEKLTPQESRNAIYPGPMNDVCLRQSRNRFLCLTWGIPEPSSGEIETGEPDEEVLGNDRFREMFDVELVLRAFAFRQDVQYMRGALRDYFDSYLRAANQFPVVLLDQLESVFEESIRLAYEILGERAFWLWRERSGKWNWLSRPTTVAYDTIMSVLGALLHRADELRSAAEDIRRGMPDFYERNYEAFAGRYTNPANIAQRRSLFEDYVVGAIGAR
jgi:hypothetical protein